jgi:hypothetical protein
MSGARRRAHKTQYKRLVTIILALWPAAPSSVTMPLRDPAPPRHQIHFAAFRFHLGVRRGLLLNGPFSPSLKPCNDLDVGQTTSLWNYRMSLQLTKYPRSAAAPLHRPRRTFTDQLLWAVLSFGPLSNLAAHQPYLSAMGERNVQVLARAQAVILTGAHRTP